MEQQHMFTNRMIRNLLVPVVLEQILNSIMGTADTMMVSNVGSAALSAVSLVDSINVLLIQAFSALAAGGAIVCAQYIGQRNYEKANMSARQVLFIITAISVVVSAVCLIFQKAAFEADLRCGGCGCYACIGKPISFSRHCHSPLLRLMILRLRSFVPRRIPRGL